MMRKALAALAIGACVLGSAYAQEESQGRLGVFDPAEEIVDQAIAICAAVVVDGQTFESQFEGRTEWRTADPRGAGSNLATHAWQSATLNTTYVLRLPNGGCSFGVQRGDSEALRARIEAALAPRAAFELVSQQAARGGRATMYAYCVREDHPRVMSIVAGRGGGQPNLVMNLFRASDVMPSFCTFG